MSHAKSPLQRRTRADVRHALPRVVFVVGATSSGKTDLGVRLAKQFNGEVVNADSRQIYKEVDIGTGRPQGRRQVVHGRAAYVVQGVPHYLMAFLSPHKTYSVAEWRQSALLAIKGIVRRGKLPIVVGGTGLYISSLIDNYEFPNVPPQPVLRKAYEMKSLEELARILLAADADAGSVVDLKNKRRVVRALEIISFSGKKMSVLRAKNPRPFVDAFQVGLRHTPEALTKRLEASVDKMMERGLMKEVRCLLDKGLSPDIPGMTSIGYRDLARAVEGEISEKEAVELLKRRTRQYAKRQATWFKRDPRIHWAPSATDAMKAVGAWLKLKL